MKITRQTIDILKNFSTINSSILVKPGSELKTISTMKNILAKSTVTEEFSQQFAIYDLIEFLGVVTSESFENAEFEFENDRVNILNGRSSTKYFYADPSTVVKPEKTLTMPESEINFELSREDLVRIISMASVLTKPDLAITSDGEIISAVILDKKDVTSNDYRLSVGEGNGEVYKMYFKVENLKVLKGTYNISISSRGISHWKNSDIPLEYWIALEDDLEYGV